MSSTVPAEQQFQILSSIPKKDENGRVTAVMELMLSSVGNRHIVEFPFHHDYFTLAPGSFIMGTMINDQVTLNIRHTDIFATRLSQRCPFCGNTLISLDEGVHDLYCFNPSCCQNTKSGLSYTFFRLNLFFDDSLMDYIFDVMRQCNPSSEINILTVFSTIRRLIYYSSIRDERCVKIYYALKHCILHLRVSEFLKILHVPGMYDDDIYTFDTTFGSIREFYNEMQDYRSMNPRLPMYNPNLMNLIYIIMKSNDDYVSQLFEIQSSIANESI